MDNLTSADLAALRALCDKATPGPWEWWTSCSFRRLTGPGGRDGGVLCAVVQRSDGHPDVLCREEDRAFIAASREAMPRLLDALEAVTKERDEAVRCTKHGAEHLAQFEYAAYRLREAFHPGDTVVACTTPQAAAVQLVLDADDAIVSPTFGGECPSPYAVAAEQTRLRQAEEAHRVTEEANVARLSEERARLLAEVERLRGALRPLMGSAEITARIAVRNCIEDKGGPPACQVCRNARDTVMGHIAAARTVLGEEGTR